MTSAATTIPHDIQARGENTVLFYLYLLEDQQQSPRMAEMLALRQAPRIMTDDVALAGIPTISDMYYKDPKMTDRLCQIAMKRGYKPRPTDRYLHSVARAEGDPGAFLNFGHARGELKKTLESRGMAGTGMVEVKAREPETDPWENNVPLSPKITERIRRQKIKENPDLARADQNELISDIQAAHGSDN